MDRCGRLSLSLEIEGEGDDFCMRFVHRIGIGKHILVFQPGGVGLVQSVHQAVAEFQLGAQFEERQVEIAAYTDFKIAVVSFQLEVVVAAARQIDHGVETRYYVGAIVVQTFCTVNQMEG